MQLVGELENSLRANIQLKILIKIKQEEQDIPDHIVSAEGVIAVLLSQNLEGKNLATLDELTLKWQSLISES